MNNRGQTLILFVLLFPIFILLLILVIDIGNIAVSNIKLKNISNIAISYGLDNMEEINAETIYEIINKNDNNVNTYFDINDDIINLRVSKNIKGVINKGKIYKLMVCYQGYILEDKKIIRSDNCGA